MSPEVILISALLVVVGLYLLGHNLIDAYFRRKEKFVETLQDKVKGGSNGSTE